MAQHALAGPDWISEARDATTPTAELALASAWIVETEATTQLPRVYYAITGAVPAPSAAVHGIATPVPYGGSVIRSSALPDGWLVETGSTTQDLPFSWVRENTATIGAAADFTAVVPAPFVPMHGNVMVRATFTGGPSPFAVLTGSMPAIEIGQIFDNVPAPAAVMAAATAKLGAIAGAVDAPVASLSATVFNTKLGDISAIVDGPVASVSVFLVQPTPSVDIDGRIPAPLAILTAGVKAVVDLLGIVDAPVASIDALATHATLADIGAVVPDPVAFVGVGITTGVDVASEIPAPTASIRARIFSQAVFEPDPFDSFTVRPDQGAGSIGFVDDFRPN